MYQLLFHPQATKNLKRLHPNDRKRILAKIDSLSKGLNNPALDIRKLAHTKNSFRLRSGDVRVIFELEERSKTIYIWDVDYRGQIY